MSVVKSRTPRLTTISTMAIEAGEGACDRLIFWILAKLMLAFSPVFVLTISKTSPLSWSMCPEKETPFSILIDTVDRLLVSSSAIFFFHRVILRAFLSASASGKSIALPVGVTSRIRTAMPAKNSVKLLLIDTAHSIADPRVPQVLRVNAPQ
jgi:hypothetical protein